MKVIIIYCDTWDFRQQASRAEDEITKEYPHATLIPVPSVGGIFQILVDGHTIFSNKDTKEFPIKGELVTHIKKIRISST